LYDGWQAGRPENDQTEMQGKKAPMTQEEILKAIEARLQSYEEFRKTNDKHREDDNSFPYYENGYESGFRDIITFLKKGKWRW
jgi:hypothetical protein